MKEALVDTNILSLFFRGHPQTALTNGLVMITENRRHFDRIVELEVDNWAEAPAE